MKADRLVLIGAMGAGKTTVGERVAADRGWAFLDLDGEVEREEGRSVAQLFAERGETGFRDLESRCLRRLVATAGPWVLACGGGAVLREENRELLRAAGPVVWLQAPPAELARRVGELPGRQRPLLAGPGEVSARLGQLLDERGAAYAATADLAVPTAGCTPARVGDEIRGWLDAGPPPRWTSHAEGGRRLWVPATPEPYPIEIGKDVGQFGPLLRERLPEVRRVALLTDRTVGRLYGEALEQSLTRQGIASTSFGLEPGEQSKRLETLARIWDWFAEQELDRTTPVVALGGGVVSDLAGFAAATWQRGIPWAVIGTTLLAQVDASVGGKTGIDHLSGKNRIGAFYAPRLVFLPLGTLRTLPARELRAGLAEVVKTAVIGDPVLFQQCRRLTGETAADEAVLPELVARAILVKARIVAADEREQGLRRRLNLGHTLGHALEAASLTTASPLLHGEAVALGLVAATRLGRQQGVLPADEATQIVELLAQLQLPVQLDDWRARMAEGGGMRWLRADKKRQGGRIAFQIPEAIGRVTEQWLTPEEIAMGLDLTGGGVR